MRHLTTIFIVALLGAIALSFAVQAWNRSSALELETPVDLPPPIPADEIVDEVPKPQPSPDVPAVEPPQVSPTPEAAANCEGGECQPQRRAYSAPQRRRLFPRIFGR